jgi:hypothetical protein
MVAVRFQLVSKLVVAAGPLELMRALEVTAECGALTVDLVAHVTHVGAAELMLVGALAAQVELETVTAEVGAVLGLELALVALVLDAVVVLEFSVLLEVQL